MRNSDVLAAIPVIVCEGDETGQELLEEALRVLEPDVIGFPVELTRFDLSLEARRRTANRVVHDAAEAMRETGLGLKAATITPAGPGDVGSPNRILREAVGGSIILRTGRRIPGVPPLAPVVHPIAIVRMATGDAYGAKEGRTGDPGDSGERAQRTETITRASCRQVAEYAFRVAAQMRASVYGGPKWTVSTVYEAMLKEEMDAAAGRHGEVDYRPVLIDAAYAGLLTESAASPLVVPSLNRDGDCLSDLVLALFGSIAGAESVLMAFDDELRTRVAMAEAPHGTAPSLQGKDVANPMAMLFACAAVLEHATDHGHHAARLAASAIRDAALGAAADGIRTFDLGGSASTSEVVDDVIGRICAMRSGSSDAR
jgi:isocitrate dehydrogenase (NAD+)